jgi:hypothetical protein
VVPVKVEVNVRVKVKGRPYRAAAAAGCEGVGNATLAMGALVSGVRGGVGRWVRRGRRVRRRRAVHSSTVTERCRGRGALAYDARLLLLVCV